MALKFDVSHPLWMMQMQAQQNNKLYSQLGEDLGSAMGGLAGGIAKKAKEKWGKPYAKALEEHEASGSKEDFMDLGDFKVQEKARKKEAKWLSNQKKDEGFKSALDEAWQKHVGDTAGEKRGPRSEFEAKHARNLHGAYTTNQEKIAQTLKDDKRAYKEEGRAYRKERRAAFFDKLFHPDKFKTDPKEEVKKPLVGIDDPYKDESYEITDEEALKGSSDVPYGQLKNVPTIKSNIEQEQGYTMGKDTYLPNTIRGMPNTRFERTKIDSPLGGYLNQMTAKNPLPYQSKLGMSVVSQEDADKAYQDAQLREGSTEELSDEEIEYNELERRYNLSDEERYNERQEEVRLDPNASPFDRAYYSSSYKKNKYISDSNKKLNQNLIHGKEALGETVGEYYDAFGKPIVDKVNDPNYNPLHGVGSYIGDKMYDIFN